MASSAFPEPVSGIKESLLDAAGDIVYASADNTPARLAIGSTNQALGVSGGVPAYQASSKSTLTTTGDIMYASAANTPARLGIGSTGQSLVVASGIPSWATPAAGGKVLQVVSANTTTYAQNNSNSYVDTTLTASITPTLNTSKILILVQQGGIFINSGSQSNACSLRLLRGATALSDMYNIALHAYTGNLTASAAMNYLDSPATTSSTTYKTQWSNPGALSYTTCQDSGSTSTITLLEIGA